MYIYYLIHGFNGRRVDILRKRNEKWGWEKRQKGIQDIRFISCSRDFSPVIIIVLPFAY